MKALKVNSLFTKKGIPFTLNTKLYVLVILNLLIFIEVAFCQDSMTAIENQKVNIMYSDINNPLLIVSELEFDSISISHGKVSPQRFKKTKSVEIVVNAGNTRGQNVKLSIFNGETVIAMKNFILLDIPLPTAFVGGRNAGSIDKGFLLAQEGVTAVLNDFVYDLSFEVISFDISVETVDNIVLTCSSRSWCFTKEQKKIIQTLNTDQKMVIENIKVKGPGGIRDISPIVLIIK